MSEPVIFAGEFNLNEALNSFNKFASEIESRFKRINATITAAVSPSGGQKTYADVLADKHKSLADKLNAFAKQSAKVNSEFAKNQEQTEARVTASQERIGQGFLNIAVRSYALHQIGNFLERTVTQPLKELAHEVLDTTLRFDILQQLLTQRAGKSVDQVGKSFDAVGRIAKLRNLDLETSVNLYSKLFEATRGALDDQLFEKIGKGLSNVLTTIESSEKRAFFGQIQDVLGGGNVANLQRTLSLAPALKSVFDEIQQANDTLSDKDTLIQAFAKLGELPALGDLATKIKNVRVEFELLAYKIGQVYKKDIENIVTFISDKAIPALDNLFEKFRTAPPLLQRIVALAAGLAAALAPIVSTLGTIILLFPNSALATGFFSTILETLAGIPALLNPITAVVVGLVAILTKAFVENQGGFRDAVDYLMETALPTLGNILKALYDTLKNIVLIFVNFYNLIDKIIPLTATIGVIASGLVYILASAISLLNVLQVIPAILGFVADILNGDIELAFARISLAVVKMLADIKPLSDLLKYIFGVDLQDNVKDLQKEVTSLEHAQGIYNDTAITGAQQQDRAQKELLSRYQQVQTSVRAITEAIKEQNRAIDAQIAKNRQAAVERANQYANQLAQERTAGFAQGASDADISTQEGRDKATAAFETSLTSQTLGVEAERVQRIQKNIRAYLTKQREGIVNALEKEVKQNGEQLDKDTKQIYETYAELLEQAITQKQNITAEGGDNYIFNILQKRISGLKVSDVQIKALAQYLANERELFKQTFKGEVDDTSEILNNQKSANEKRQQFYENLRKAAEEEEKIRKSAPIQNQLSGIEYDIERLQGYKSSLLALKDEYVDLDKFVGALTGIEDQLITAFKERADKEKELAFIQYKNGAEYNAAIDKIDQQLKENIDKLKDTTRHDKDEVFRSINKDQVQQADQLRGLIESLQSNVTDFIDKSIATGNLDENKIRKINSGYDFIFQLLSEQNLKKLQELTRLATPILGGIAGGVAEPLRKAFEELSKVSETDLANPQVRQAMIDQSEDVVKILNGYINASNQLDPQGRAQIELFINQYIKFIGLLNEGQSVLTKKIDIDVLKLRVKEEDLNRQQDIVDLTRDELDLTQQILQLRQQRGVTPDIKGLGSFGKAIVDIFDNGRKAQNELQKEILKQELQAAQIEIDLAITRLQIEEQIYILKLKEAGATDAEIQKVREEYEHEIDLIKEKGVLQKTLIEEQLKALQEFSGGIGDIFGQILGKVFGKLIGGAAKASGDAVGNSGGDEEDTGLSGQGVLDDPVVSDASVDATEQNVKETNGWLDNLKGGLKTTKDAIFALGDAIAATNDLSVKGILRTIKAELKALGTKLAIKALEFAALAAAALVFGDYATAGKAAAAAVAYGVASAAAFAGAGLIGTIDGNGAANTQSSASRSAGTSNAATPANDKQILKQQALSVFIALDIRTDDGIIIKKNIKALNQNTELTNLTLNSQEGWAFAPTV
jgi:hypothetical protein